MSEVRTHASLVHQRCQALITRFLQRYWYRAAQGAGGLGDLFVTIEEVSAELEIGQLQPPIAFDPPEDVEARLQAARAAERDARGDSETLPAVRLLREVALDEDALEILLVLNALQASPGLLRTCTFAWADFSVKQPTAGFVVELLSDDVDHRVRLESALSPDAPLRRLQLVLLGEDRRWQPATPILQRPIFVPDAVGRFLAMEPVVDETYPSGAVVLEMEGPAPDALIIADRERGDHLLESQACRVDWRPILLVGSTGAGRRTWARAHALANNRPLFVVEVGALPWELEPFENQLSAVLRDGLLNGAMILLRCEGFEDKADRRTGILGRVIRGMRVPVVISVYEGGLALVTSALPDVHVIHTSDAALEDRPRLYGRLMRLHDFAVEPEQLASVCDHYRLRPGDLDHALSDIRITAGDAPELDAKEFDAAVRRQIRTNLASLASPVTTTQRWSDLVLPEEPKLLIEEIILHARFRTRVFEEWGFGRKVGSRGRGLGCLFSGPPGTGKTMTATLIAQELGLDLYQVDLSRIVDKYVGETEKNLARLFDEASRVPVVLLFDEADSLFASRTKVESSNDRYANLEVNFLLQRMEVHDGISILTTNMGTGIDQAFKRRLRFRVHFDLPEADERESLWRAMVPPGLVVSDDIDWTGLAKRWEISGALIRNAMLRAAFLAAAYDKPLNNEVLLRATRSELIEMGRLGS